VALNDEIVTQSAPAMVRFADGTVVTLQRNSRMLLKQGASGVEVNMLAGSAIYDLKPNSNVSIPNVAAAGVSAGQKATRKLSSGNETTAMALALRGPSAGVALAPVTAGTLAVDARGGSSTFGQLTPQAHGLNPTNTSEIIIPTGADNTILSVHLVSAGSSGQPSAYIIDNITLQIPDPTRPGQFIYVTPPAGFGSPLIGASFYAPTAGPGFNATIPFNVYLQNGTLLTPGAFTNYLQQAVTAAYNDPKNPNIPQPGTTAPTYTTPISLGTLSTVP
jgi:hypothetical protein